MISIITGDIINSRKTSRPGEWLKALKKTLSLYGKSPQKWEIYRGDSFQLEVTNISDSFLAAIRIKAAIKSFKGLDVRMAIGIGEKTFPASKITESNGPAFIHSGELFEQIRKNRQTLAVKSPWPGLDKELNLIISLSCIAMDKWTPPSAELVNLSLGLKEVSQKTLMKKLGIVQSAVSERQARAYFTEIMAAEHFIHEKLTQQIK